MVQQYPAPQAPGYGNPSQAYGPASGSGSPARVETLVLSVDYTGGIIGAFIDRRSKLQTEIDDKTRIANNLPRLQKEYDQLNIELAQALTELPNSKEIPSLLTSITALGKNAGLDFLVFRPKGEVVKDFYAEVPVDIIISGSYFSVANFFAAVSNLPRIVNITNVAFSDIKNVNNRMMTKVTCLATTFRFLDKKEIKDDKKPAPIK